MPFKAAKILMLTVLISVIFSQAVHAADRYYVGGNGDNWNNTNSWSDASGGTPGVSVPGSSDDVIFDSNSGANDCDIDNTFNVDILSLTLDTGYTGEISGGNSTTFDTGNNVIIRSGTLTMGSKSLTIGGDFKQSGGTFNGGTNSSHEVVISGGLFVNEGTFDSGSNDYEVTANIGFNNNDVSWAEGALDATIDLSGTNIFDMNNNIYIGDSGASGSVTAGTTWQLAGNMVRGTGTTTNDNGNTLFFDGASNASIFGSFTWESIVIDKDTSTRGVSFTSDLTIDTSLLFTTGKLWPDNVDIYFGGTTWTMTTNGEFVHNYLGGSSTVYFTKEGGTTALFGSTTFGDIDFQVNTNTLFQLEEAETQTFTGTMTLKGSGPSARLYLISDNSGNQAKIDAQGTRDIAYLDVKDNWNINASDIQTSGFNINDSGNNDGWDFGSGATAIPEFSTWLLILTMLIGVGLIQQRQKV